MGPARVCCPFLLPVAKLNPQVLYIVNMAKKLRGVRIEHVERSADARLT
jgi:hypothetical protein